MPRAHAAEDRPARATVDLDIDSDNDGELKRSEQEEAVEDSRVLPGKIMPPNDGDVDGDGVPDFADGFDGFGNEGEDASAPFVPFVVSIPEGLDPARARLRFQYSASDPAGVTRSQAEGEFEPTYVPAPGRL